MASPIEDMLFGALCAAVPRGYPIRHPLESEPGDPWILQWSSDRMAFLYRDHPALTYRVDMLLTPGRPRPRYAFALVIECDGHDFHDRTRQQAAYDRARDRELLLRGITTVRFTGSEIFHSPERCATEALGVFAKLSEHAREPESYCASWGG